MQCDERAESFWWQENTPPHHFGQKQEEKQLRSSSSHSLVHARRIRLGPNAALAQKSTRCVTWQARKLVCALGSLSNYINLVNQVDACASNTQTSFDTTIPIIQDKEPSTTTDQTLFHYIIITTTTTTSITSTTSITTTSPSHTSLSASS